MRSIPTAQLLRVSVVLTGLIAQPPASLAQEQMGTVGNAPVFRVWTYVTGPLDLADRDTAEQIAQDLLGTAGITVDWRHCDRAGTCSLEDVAPPSVTLILMSAVRPTCGTAALAPAVKAATVLVSVPCVEEVVFKLQRRVSTRTHPRVSTLKRRHLLGAAIAHELGHVLGLPHASTGLMRARLEIGDIVALMQGTLTFSGAEVERMRTSAMWEAPVLTPTAIVDARDKAMTARP
ncbi:hypothetical protein LuPra_02629 [Luteitalea pratensis]|uniref:Matrixin n=1 Tax=Luteitalea pratensis TaxID=1855912 RepID=A0A143PLE5_LUTPR|nr:hypothetical protein [Luteitalea pratensis]AMY09412.1 hypothetical protein LuPra_02629 [Luteitalea pratensis]